MSPSAFSILGPPGLGGEGGGDQTWTKTFLGQVGMCVQNFIMIPVQGIGFPLALHIPTNKQTNKHLYAHFYIYRR